MLRSTLIVSGLLLTTGSWLEARAQFPSTPTQTFYVCNATGAQSSVRAFADGTGGSFVYWIDKRGGTTTGTAIYGQHFNAAGTALWAANGKLLYQSAGREVWAMVAVPWNNATVMAWVQGPSGAGGDSVYCQVFNARGDAQWQRPTMVAARGNGVIYEDWTGLNAIPTDSGVTVTHSLIYSGGAESFTFNRIRPNGQRRWANHPFSTPLGNTSYYNTIADGTNGFYVVGSTGGIGARLVAQRYDLQGNAGFPTDVDLSAPGAGGRGNSGWRLNVDGNNHLYVTWGNSQGDVVTTKVLPTGAFAWTPAFRNICPFPAAQDNPHAIWHDAHLWVTFVDSRPPAANTFEYVQKIRPDGTFAWDRYGRQLCTLGNYITDPKLAPTDNGAAVAFFKVGAGFMAQKVLADSTLAWAPNGVPINTTTNDQPFYQDYVAVPQPNGDTHVFWTSFSGEICGARLYPNGGLVTGLAESPETEGVDLYPNPAGAELRLTLPNGELPRLLELRNAIGRSVRQVSAADRLSVADLPNGLYFVHATLLNGQTLTRRVAISK